MPYIKQEERIKLRPLLHEFNKHVGEINSGKFNYIISRMIYLIVHKRGMSYDLINQLIGALECSKLEFYRRGAVGHEKKKMQENGDVYVVDDVKEEQNEGKKSLSSQ